MLLLPLLLLLKSLQSCPTLSDPMGCSPPGSSVHGIFQARGLEWGAIAFSGVFPIQTLLPWTHNVTSQFFVLFFFFNLPVG